MKQYKKSSLKLIEQNSDQFENYSENQMVRRTNDKRK